MTPPPRFPLIVGPTAGGKSALGVAVGHLLAQRGLAAEIVTADAFQVYRGLDIGTAKPTPAERGGLPHHLIDLVEPGGEPFTLHDWLAAAHACVEAIKARGAVPIVVGGTHLYAKALLEGVFEGPEPDEATRERFRQMDPHQRRALLERVDPAAAERIHPNDERRTVRALEVHTLTGRPITELQTQWDRERPPSPWALVGLEWPTEAINRRINARVRAMVEGGLVEEARSLWARGALVGQAGQALGYKQLVEYFEGRCTLEEAVERTKIETRRLAKNQRTWLRRLRGTPGSRWIDARNPEIDGWAQLVVDQCFAQV